MRSGGPELPRAIGCSTRYRVCLRVMHPPKIFKVQVLGNDGRPLGVHSSTPLRIRPRNQAIWPNFSRGCVRGWCAVSGGGDVVVVMWCCEAFETFDVPAGVLFRGPRQFFWVAEWARGARVQIGVAGCAQGARVLTLVHTGPGSTETISAPGAGFPELQMRSYSALSII